MFYEKRKPILMKTKLTLIILAVVALISCEKEKEEPIPEVPDQVIRTQVNPVLFSRIEQLFPSGTDLNNNLPFLYSDTIQKKIILTRDSKVFLTFIAEKALYKNTVGWYSYPANKPPKGAGDINIHVLFPNVSGKGEGGELLQGDMLQLGDSITFSKGTVIGFFLIINGWQNGYINYGGTTHYTDSQINKEQRQYHVLFRDKNTGHVVLGFEDMEYGKSDNDFNDLLFIVSDNKDNYETISFDIAKVPVL